MAEQGSLGDGGQPGSADAAASDVVMVFGQETLDAMGTLAVAFDREGRILYVNRAFTETTGCANAVLLGRPLWEAPTPPDEADAVRQRVAQLVRSRAPAGYEGHLAGKDGTRHWIVWSDAPQVDAHGGLRGVLSVGIDCTTHHRVVEWDAFLSEAATVLTSPLDLEGALTRLAHLAVPRFADWCIVYRIDDEGEIRRLAIAHTDHGSDRIIAELARNEPPRLAQAPEMMARLRAGESILIEEVTDSLLEALASSKTHLELMRWLGLRSAMLVPLRSRERLLGAVAFLTTRSGRRYDREDLSRAKALADRAAVAADNARLYAELRETARRYEASLAQLELVLQSAPVGFVFLDRDLRYVSINEYLASYDGISIEDHLGRTIHEVIGEKATHIAPLLRQVIETACPIEGLETTMERPGTPGQLTHWLSSYYPVCNHEGDVVGVGSVVMDITERRRAEEALRASEERFRTLVERISDWVWEVDANDVYTYSSPRVRDLLGYEPEEVIGKTPFDFMPEDEAERVRREYHEMVAKCQSFTDIENRNRRKDGRIVVVETSGAPILGEDGRLLGYRGTDRDITERKHTEETHRFLAEATRVLTETLDAKAMLAELARLAVPAVSDWCIVYTIDENENVHRVALEHVNPAKDELARRLLALPPPALWRVAPEVEALRTGRPQLMPRVPERVLQALATSPEHLEILHELGATTALVVPLHTRGRLLGVIHLFMTESGRHYDEPMVALADSLAGRAAVALDNARLYEEATAANAAKDQFLAVLSHELRNPLAPILAGASVLKRVATGDERVQRTVGIIERNVKLQARLVNDLLDLSRIKRGKIRLQCVPTQLDSVVQAAVQTQRPDAEDAGLDLQEQLQTGLWVHGDPDRLQQVVMNLLTNAIKFTPQPGQICVRLEQVDSTGRITVTDTGIGISPDLLPNLFAMFQQGEVAGRRAAGLGIGLSLVKSITELHGGRVRAESEGPGKGSRFIVELPLVAPPQAAPGTETAGSSSRVRVLLVEDNPDTRALLAEGLEAAGHTVRAEATGEESLEWLGHEHPDVIVSDIGLPGMDGYELLRRARELPGMQGVPAFAVTGYGAPFDVERAREAGFDGHFTKPVDVGTLDRRIRERMADGRTASQSPSKEPDT